MGLVLILLGLAIMLVGGIWMAVVAFQESVWWGLGYLFVPFVSLVFLIMHWQVAKKPFLVSLVGLVPYVLGIVLSPDLTQV